MKEKFDYQVKLTWLENRTGILQSDVLDTVIEVATPPEFTKGVTGIWSPEHLFIASVSSCFMTTFLALAEKSKLEFVRFTCHAQGVVETKDGKLCISTITLNPMLTIADKKAFAKGMKVLNVTEKSCLITNSIKSKILFAPLITVSQEH